jgi:hypothetical protein
MSCNPVATFPAFILLEIGYTWSRKEKAMATATIRETLLQEVSGLSSAYDFEVLNFIKSLKANRQSTVPETMLLSESALSKDWDTQEEDNAWASL